MNKSRNIHLFGIPFICLLITLLIASCASQENQGSPIYSTPSPMEAPRSFATMTQDTLLLARIKTKIFSDDMVDGDDIHLLVRHGVVYITGTTTDNYQRRVTADLIRSVDDVVRVENQLHITQPGTTFETKKVPAVGL